MQMPMRMSGCCARKYSAASRLNLPILGIAAGLLMPQACRPTSPIPDVPDSNAWPWMSAQIPAEVELSARVLSTDTAPEHFQGILTFRNAGRDSVRVTFGACSFGLRLYRDSSLNGQPQWDNRPGPNVDCLMIGYDVTLGPSEQRDRVLSSAPGVLARIPAPGRYAAALPWRPSVNAPIRTVAAGSLVIRYS